MTTNGIAKPPKNLLTGTVFMTDRVLGRAEVACKASTAVQLTTVVSSEQVKIDTDPPARPQIACTGHSSTGKLLWAKSQLKI